jgi:hypothetical protein
LRVDASSPGRRRPFGIGRFAAASSSRAGRTDGAQASLRRRIAVA